MSHGLNKFSTRTKLLVGALALVLAGASHATGTLVGGGATLPSVGYVGTNAATTSTLQFTGTGIASNSLFGAYQAQTGNPSASYCLTGSGAGKNILAGATGFSVQNACSSAKSGFGAPAVSRTDLTQPNFAAADSPLATSDLANYHTGHGAAAWPTQFPAIAGAVGIAINLKDSAGTQLTANFSTAQVCKIFSGTVTTWNDASLASAFTLASGHTIPAQPINVQYRQDGSGTSFSLSNFLTNNCGSAGLSQVFETSQTFGSTTAGAGGTPAAGSVISNFFSTLPSTWTATSGNTGVANAVGSTANSVGYVETANVLALNAAGVTSLVLANVNSKSPTTNFGSALTLPGAAIVYNEVIGSTNNTNGTATLSAISGAPSTQCIALVAPANYAVAGSKGSVVPSTSYPIVAISYLLGNAQSNGTDLTNTANLVNAPYNSTLQSAATLVGPGKGLAFLTLGTGAFTATAPGACLN